MCNHHSDAVKLYGQKEAETTGEIHRWSEYNRFYNQTMGKVKKALDMASDGVSEIVLKYGAKKIYNRKSLDTEIADFLAQFSETFFQSVFINVTVYGAYLGLNRYYMIVPSGSVDQSNRQTFDEANPIIQWLLKHSMERVKTIAFLENQERIREVVISQYLAGNDADQIASAIRKAIVDEPLYKYKRLVRSETQLASDHAIVSQARKDGASGVQWKTSLRPCKVCQPLHNLIWLPGENPRVVYDTHPGCLCNVVPIFRKLKVDEIQPKWSTEPQWAYQF